MYNYSNLMFEGETLPRFVVHEHAATHLHWDFRLEMDGVLKSWAVPKGPPQEAAVKRLAIEVEDHDLDYIDFEGEITEGYGKGKVAIWDSGTYKLLQRDEKSISFLLQGRLLKGNYRLILTKYSKRGERQWLLIKTANNSQRKSDETVKHP
jgi:DNA ligase D-like protein (predicted 3'-phosphoesterase)